jgi:hypothetical protein
MHLSTEEPARPPDSNTSFSKPRISTPAINPVSRKSVIYRADAISAGDTQLRSCRAEQHLAQPRMRMARQWQEIIEARLDHTSRVASRLKSAAGDPTSMDLLLGAWVVPHNTGLRYRVAVVRGIGLSGSSLATLRFVRWPVVCDVFFAALSCPPLSTCYTGHL